MKASEQPKKTHAAVLRALEVANLALGRAVTIEEIIEALAPEERVLLERTYDFPLGAVIGSILKLLSVPSENRGLVYSPGLTNSRRRCFASTRVLKPEEAALPEAVTRRELVVALVRHAALELGRAVRIVDAIKFAEDRPEYARLSASQIQNAIIAAHVKGELISMPLRGLHRNLYLPADLNPEDYAPPKPLHWIEWVKAAFEDLWDEHVRDAKELGRLPRPATTRQVRARLVEMGCDDPKLQDKATVVNALWELSKHSNAALRRISRRSRKSLFWCPVDVPDDGLDLGNAYASDLERVGAAVARATARLERPVTLREIEQEVENDSALRPMNYPSVSKAVTAAVDYLDSDGNAKTRSGYIQGHVQSIGLLKAKALYYPTIGNAEQARAYVEFRQLEEAWEELRADEQLYEAQGCRLPTVAVGRVRLLALQARRFAGRLRGMIGAGELKGKWADEAEILIERAEAIDERARDWPLPFAVGEHQLPEQPSDLVPTLTKEELRALLHPIYPHLQQKVERAYQVTTLLSNRIRRVSTLFSLHKQYDRTDALFFAARRFGGKECVFLAGLASAELGLLRDPTFIFPAVEAADPDARLAAVACLAFLQTEKGSDLLKTRVMKDNEKGIRQSALWAYAFAQGEWAHDLATVMMRHDGAEEVREFAAQIAKADGAAIWLL
ncbi:MAG TPA: hypothetical protein VM911_08570 [Pyrinomonadaceae bacterium]|jgi:hypothetical protein|nr:hypothetical protein [Pyrinomonadaceae bacterium]